MIDIGLNEGDRIAIQIEKSPHALAIYAACVQLGIVFLPLNPAYTMTEVEFFVSDSSSKLIICDTKNKAQLNLIGKKFGARVMTLNSDGSGTFSDLALSLNGFSEICSRTANDLVAILYTSGTTGAPKGIVRDIGGHIVALKWTMKNIYNIDTDDIWWSASDIGWIVGHSYIVYAPLFKGCTTVLFEGKPVGTPDAGVFWKIISDYKVKSLFTAPTAFRAIKKEDPEGKFFSKYDLSSFKSLFLAGERADPDTIKWAEKLLKVPVIDHWWQTETSWAISANCTGIEMMKTKYGSACKAVPGYDVKIIKPDQTLAKPNEMGDIVVKLPLPPGTFPTLWNADKRYEETYMTNYEGYYQTYDAGHIDDDGYISIMSRTDDIINVAGHRLSTGAIEEVLSEHQSVAECAVLGVADKLKGQLPIGLITLKTGVDKDDETIIKECIQMVRDKVGPVAAFKVAIVVKRLPKTRSGKILRGTVRKIADNEPYKMPATIDDPAILTEIKEDLIKNNILKD